MQPIYFEVDSHLPLMIVPESDAHMDGHPVLTYTYAIFKDPGLGLSHFSDPDSLLTRNKKTNPDYLGTLTFEEPGRLFSYEADGQQELPGGAIQEIIEQITHYRDNANLWSL